MKRAVERHFIPTPQKFQFFAQAAGPIKIYQNCQLHPHLCPTCSILIGYEKITYGHAEIKPTKTKKVATSRLLE